MTRKSKKNQKRRSALTNNYSIKETISKEEMIDIYAEAYYRALKRIERETKNESLPKQQNVKYKWYNEIWSFIKFIFCPWAICKKQKIKHNAHDNMLVLVITLALYAVGAILWGLGIYKLICAIGGLVNIIKCESILLNVIVAIYSLIFSSIITISAKTFSEEQDSDKIYAFSSAIIALAGCIISVITLVEKYIQFIIINLN